MVCHGLIWLKVDFYLCSSFVLICSYFVRDRNFIDILRQSLHIQRVNAEVTKEAAVAAQSGTSRRNRSRKKDDSVLGDAGANDPSADMFVTMMK